MFEITPSSLRELAKERNYYQSRLDLNEVLHLQHKGITRLVNLEEFTGLKTLYLECNAIQTIENLDKLVSCAHW